jgi:hypothetical protein
MTSVCVHPTCGEFPAARLAPTMDLVRDPHEGETDMRIKRRADVSESRTVIRIGNLRLTEGERHTAEESVRSGERIAELVLRAGASLRSALARLSGLFARLKAR